MLSSLASALAKQAKLAKYDPDLESTLSKLAEVYQQQKNYSKAEPLLNRMLRIANSFNSKNFLNLYILNVIESLNVVI